MLTETAPLPPVLPLFDAPRYLDDGNALVNQHLAEVTLERVPDAALVYEYAVEWLSEQRNQENNYKTYRSELTTYFHWCFDVEGVSLAAVDRRMMNRYVEYCLNPPRELISQRNVPQFVTDKGWDERVPNPLWLPFLGKKEQGEMLPYRLSDKALKTKMAVLSSFYDYLINEEYTERNPAVIWLKHSRFSRHPLSKNLAEEGEIRAFSELQWSYVMTAAEAMAAEDPLLHERTLFLVSLMYGCYLRISEVAAHPGFSPVMGQFRRDSQTGIWTFFIPVSKGGKKRHVAVSDQLLAALQRYRHYLGLSDYPTAHDITPLFVRHKAAGRGRDAGLRNANLGIRQIRDVVMTLFERAAVMAEADGFAQDASEIRQMTPHSLRHTGITHDININGRPLSHVQADAGHDSIETTSQYLHTSTVERHESAARKPLNHLKGIG